MVSRRESASLPVSSSERWSMDWSMSPRESASAAAIILAIGPVMERVRTRPMPRESSTRATMVTRMVLLTPSAISVLASDFFLASATFIATSVFSLSRQVSASARLLSMAARASGTLPCSTSTKMRSARATYWSSALENSA
ncbi:MAG: hypothetical protein QM765_41860 [Myxococcales bacterium]